MVDVVFLDLDFLVGFNGILDDICIIEEFIFCDFRGEIFFFCIIFNFKE